MNKKNNVQNGHLLILLSKILDKRPVLLLSKPLHVHLEMPLRRTLLSSLQDLHFLRFSLYLLI